MKHELKYLPPKPPCITHRELGMANLPELADDITLVMHQLKIMQARVNYILAAVDPANTKDE